MQRVIRDASTPAGEMAALDARLEIIRRHTASNVARLYAIPRVGSGGVLEWWTELGGQAVAFSALDQDQQRLLLHTYQQRQQALEQAAHELHSLGEPGTAASLQSLVGEPLPEHLYSFNGEPLVIRWHTLKPKPVPPVIPIATTVVAASSTRRRRWPWLLFALLLVLLAWLAWWFLRAPAVNPPTIPPAVVEPEVEDPAPAPQPLPEPPPEPVPQPEPVAPTPVPESTPAPLQKAKPAKACPKPVDSALLPQFVVVLDTSGSMNLNVNTSPRDDQWYGEVGATLDPRDPRVAPLLTKPTRLDVAKGSLAKMIGNLQPQVDMRFMAFEGCGRVADYGLFPSPQRRRLIKGIDSLSADFGTPLAESLAQAASKVDGRNRDAYIVMFIDGQDNCQQDACAVSRRIAQYQPRLKVNVVNIGENALSNCMAQNTGGRVYTSSNAVELTDMLQQASKEVSKAAGCP